MIQLEMVQCINSTNIASAKGNISDRIPFGQDIQFAEQRVGTMTTASSDLHTGRNQYFNQYHFLNLLSIHCFSLVVLLGVSMSFLGKTENYYKREKGLN